MDSHGDPRNRCCCNVNIEHGALAVACAGILLSLVGAALSVVWGRYLNLIPIAISILLYASIIYAKFAKIPSLYWPYLIVNGVSIALCSLYTVILVGMLFVMPVFWQRHLNETTNYQHQDAINRLPRVVTFTIIATMFLVQAMNIWFELIIYNAYGFLKRQRYREQCGGVRDSDVYRV